MNISINSPIPLQSTLPTKILNKFIQSPIGVAACPATVGSKITQLAKLGFGVFTYKTIRSKAYEGHALPNLGFIDAKTPWQVGAIPKSCIVTNTQLADFLKLSTVNSIGIACLDLALMHADIQASKQALSSEQVLSVSIYGEGETPTEQSNDYAYLAEYAIDAGADWIELNFSCPNLHGKGLLFEDDELIARIAQTVYKRIEKDIPIIAKLGFIAEKKQLEKTLSILARAGVRGICGINTVGLSVFNEKGDAYFGKHRQQAGASGYVIHDLAKQFIQQAVEINHQQKFDFAILATGGVTQANDFNHFLNLGADIAMSAMAVLWNPLIAYQFLQEKTS